MLSIDVLLGKTITHVQGLQVNSEEVILTTQCGNVYQMGHVQEGDEHISLYSLRGNLDDVLHTPIVSVEEDIDDDSCDSPVSRTWTYYRIVTAKGAFSIRWLGISDGNYSDMPLITDITSKPRNCAAAPLMGQPYGITDSDLNESVLAFGNDYGMYCDWCASLSRHTVTVTPVSKNAYMAKYYELVGVQYPEVNTNKQRKC